MISKGYYSYPFIGATLMNLFPDIAEALRLPVKSGAMVIDVTPGGPADKAGIKGGNKRAQIGNNIVIVGGDVIVSVNESRCRMRIPRSGKFESCIQVIKSRWKLSAGMVHLKP